MGKLPVESRGREEEADLATTQWWDALRGHLYPVAGVAAVHFVLLYTQAFPGGAAGLLPETMLPSVLFAYFWAFWAGRLVVVREKQWAWLEQVSRDPKAYARPAAFCAALFTLSVGAQGFENTLFGLFYLLLIPSVPFIIPLIILGPPHAIYFLVRQVSRVVEAVLPGSPARVGMRAGMAGVVGGMLGFILDEWVAWNTGLFFPFFSLSLGAAMFGAGASPDALLLAKQTISDGGHFAR